MPTTYHHDVQGKTVFEVEAPDVSDGPNNTWDIRATVHWVSAGWQLVGADYQCEGTHRFSESYNKNRDPEDKALGFFKALKLAKYTQFAALTRGSTRRR